MGQGIADLTLIGESKSTGALRMTKDVSKKARIELINQSVTGLWEKRINLLEI
jgi:hypothetical protein